MARKTLRSTSRVAYATIITASTLNGWMFYPSLLMGGIYNDNLFRTTLDRQSGFGLRARPSLVADRDEGVHHTTVYAHRRLLPLCERTARRSDQCAGGL